MKKTKIVAFKFPVKMHAELKARLLYDEIYMTKFIRHCIESYLGKDPLMLDFIDVYKKNNNVQNKMKRKKNKVLIQKGSDVEELFNLTESEVDDIFDILEEGIGDFPEL